MDEFIGFTAREKYILNGFRQPGLLNPSQYAIRELACIIPSLLFVSFYFWSKDVTWVFVGYALLLSRLVSRLNQSDSILKSYRSIFLKYEAKIKELIEVQPEEE